MRERLNRSEAADIGSENSIQFRRAAGAPNSAEVKWTF
jgi:hypothetical protein